MSNHSLKFYNDLNSSFSLIFVYRKTGKYTGEQSDLIVGGIKRICVGLKSLFEASRNANSLALMSFLHTSLFH